MKPRLPSYPPTASDLYVWAFLLWESRSQQERNVLMRASVEADRRDAGLMLYAQLHPKITRVADARYVPPADRILRGCLPGERKLTLRELA